MIYSARNLVYRDCSIRMSNRAMADFMYAVIMCNARIVCTFTLSCDRYTRKQNAYNNASVRIELPESFIPQFEEISTITLEEIETVGI
jgi:hypothetical protein